MSKRYKIQNANLGTSPGTLTYVGEEVNFETKVFWTEYNADFYKTHTFPKLGDFNLTLDADKTYWLNIDGIHEPKVIATVGEVFDLHPLVMEDILNTQQKPKFEYYDDEQLFITIKMMEFNPYTREIEVEHLSFILGEGFVISFQEERTKDVFEPILQRLKTSAGKTRRNGADYLLYALIDLVVDNYFVVLEQVSENMERLEEDILTSAKQKSLNELYGIKRELTLMRKTVFPLREMLFNLIREEAPLITPNTSLYLRDVHDHVTQVLETVDSYRELVASLMDLYLSQASNRMNNVMKVLTVISVIFMPLTFVAGIYGMNFDNMPELHWQYGYYYVWGFMILSVIGMLIYFKKKEWL
ncbi:magnesium transporter [Arcicella aurantiaca]|uniref:Magnesium transport protein CorA n=1 Tax=Arcicella aurantiaca TaxID=591202 RepID=A0A316DFL7_9BACT|nr:magnesium/cobalt transporter CorA [Arcicella aurantiaca]PWK17001.1 magnesium transporter [Arcicella aurantiaca]